MNNQLSRIRRWQRLHSEGRPHTSLTSICDHTIYPPAMVRGGTVVDLGANRGAFSLGMISLFGCRSFAVEAAPAMYEQLSESTGLRKFHYAMSSSVGTAEIAIAAESESSSIIKVSNMKAINHQTVPAIDLDTFVTRHVVGDIDLLKIDIEGAEIDVLQAASRDLLARIKQITVEFHDFNGVVSADDVHRIVSKLKICGFWAFRFSLRSHFDVLFLNSRYVPLSVWQRTALSVRPYLSRIRRAFIPSEQVRAGASL